MYASSGNKLTKIMNNLLKHLKIRTFKVIFLCLKFVKSFQQKKFSMKKSVDFVGSYFLQNPHFKRPTFINFFLLILIFKVLYFLEMFVGSVHRVKN